MDTQTHECKIVFVGLNRVLLSTDIFWELLLQTVRQRPLLLLILPYLLTRGTRRLGGWLARNRDIDPASLPYRKTVVHYLKDQKSKGRSIILVTRTPRSIATLVAEHLGLFSDVIAPEDRQVFGEKKKLEKIQNYVGNQTFEFVAHRMKDISIMEVASRVTLVHPSTRLAKDGKRLPNTQILGSDQCPWKAVIRALRPHHWSKNLLLAIPWVMAHQWHDRQSFMKIWIALLAFSLVTSAVYIWNDLLDLPADRLHPVKRKRPLANGSLSIAWALVIAFVLSGLGIFSGWVMLPGPFVWLLISYAITVLLYSAVLKHCLVLDVIVLAGLYTLRIFAGGAVVNVPVSAWLLAFSGFFFLSLAFAKRYLELFLFTENDRKKCLANRPYKFADLDLFRIAGPTCGLLSVLVLALYINSSAVQKLYRAPHVLWLLCPLFLYWILRTWMLVLRGETDSDPVVFALRDKMSLVVGASIIGTLCLAV